MAFSFSGTFIFLIIFGVFIWLVRFFTNSQTPDRDSIPLRKDISERHLPPIPTGHQILFGRVAVAGCSFRKADFCRFAMSIDKSLRLVAEPSNKHDKNAVMVIGEGDGRKYHIGYLPRELSAEITKNRILPKISPRLRYLSAKMAGYFDLEIDLTAEKSLVKSFQEPEQYPV